MVEPSKSSLTPRDSDQELAYFEFMAELGVKNASRYELQTQELVKNRKIELEIKDFIVRYKLDRVGCSFQVSKDGGKTFREKTWVRTGWRKSGRLSYLPLFFAQCETNVLLNK